MFFFFTCGTHTFTSHVKGTENLTVQCQNCGNFSGHVYKRWQWFTLCFIPLVPFSLKPYKDVGCHVCNFYQDLRYRPDVQQQMGLNGGQPTQGGVEMAPPGGGGGGYGGTPYGHGGYDGKPGPMPPPPAGVPGQGGGGGAVYK